MEPNRFRVDSVPLPGELSCVPAISDWPADIANQITTVTVQYRYEYVIYIRNYTCVSAEKEY